MVAATLLAVSPWAVVGFMIWRQHRFFDRTLRQIRALPEVVDGRHP